MNWAVGAKLKYSAGRGGCCYTIHSLLECSEGIWVSKDEKPAHTSLNMVRALMIYIDLSHKSLLHTPNVQISQKLVASSVFSTWEILSLILIIIINA
jgi:hypothetical protein